MPLRSPYLHAMEGDALSHSHRAFRMLQEDGRRSSVPLTGSSEWVSRRRVQVRGNAGANDPFPCVESNMLAITGVLALQAQGSVRPIYWIRPGHSEKLLPAAAPTCCFSRKMASMVTSAPPAIIQGVPWFGYRPPSDASWKLRGSNLHHRFP